MPTGLTAQQTSWPINPAGFVIHSAIHRACPHAACVMHTHTLAGMVVAAQAGGLLPLNQMSMEFHGRVGIHAYEGIADADNLDERERLVRDLGDRRCLILRNHGLLTVGATVAEAFHWMYYLEQSCRIQVAAQSTGATLALPSESWWPAPRRSSPSTQPRAGCRGRRCAASWIASSRITGTRTVMVEPAPHARMTGGAALVASLRVHGVTTLFGLPGLQLDGLFNALYDARDWLRVINARHEQGVAYMALGYAQATGRPGVYAVVPGPGFLNTTAALATAYTLHAPVLALIGQIAARAIGRGRGELHELPDQSAILRSLTRWSGLAMQAGDVPGLAAAAFAQLARGRGPAGLELPADVLARAGEVAP